MDKRLELESFEGRVDEGNLNVGGIIPKRNLGKSLLNPYELKYLTPMDDYLFLLDMAEDEEGYEFRNVIFSKVGDNVEWAFQYMDKETGDLVYYPVTQIKFKQDGHGGMLGSLEAVYGIEFKLGEGDGITVVWRDGGREFMPVSSVMIEEVLRGGGELFRDLEGREMSLKRRGGVRGKDGNNFR